jgi:hypothetical protein
LKDKLINDRKRLYKDISGLKEGRFPLNVLNMRIEGKKDKDEQDQNVNSKSGKVSQG